MFKKKLVNSALTLSVLLSMPAFAWDGITAGIVSRIDVVAGGAGGYDFRISMAGYPTLCTGGTNWAYVIAADPNYKAVTAAIMMAKAMGSPATVYTTRDSSNYCQIGYVVIE